MAVRSCILYCALRFSLHFFHQLHFPLFGPVYFLRVYLKSRKYGLFLQTQRDFALKSLGQYRIIPALRLKHRSGSCGTASALPKCSIIHIQYYLRFWLSSCRTSLAVSALRIMRYCPETDELFDVSDRSQLPAFNLSCVNCNPSRAILCGTYLIIKGGAALCKFATGLFEAAVNYCNFAQGIARILCRTFPERVGKTHRIALFPYAAYRWKTAQVTPGTVAFYTGYSRSPAPL